MTDMIVTTVLTLLSKAIKDSSGEKEKRNRKEKSMAFRSIRTLDRPIPFLHRSSAPLHRRQHPARPHGPHPRPPPATPSSPQPPPVLCALLPLHTSPFLPSPPTTMPTSGWAEGWRRQRGDASDQASGREEDVQATQGTSAGGRRRKRRGRRWPMPGAARAQLADGGRTVKVATDPPLTYMKM
uniref:Uncharacterized protein n=1 Tax=Oryza nivara TaxID=4536 RepID=A0A0E0HTR6_ORYNI